MARKVFRYDPTSDGDVRFYRYCKSEREASRIVWYLQSLGGSSVERDGDFVYAATDPSEDSAVKRELELAGYSVEEV